MVWSTWERAWRQEGGCIFRGNVGKNREIRKATATVGLTVNRLIRISYGPFQLNALKPGEVEEVRAKVLRDQLGIAKPEAHAAKKQSRRVSRKPRNATLSELKHS